MSAGPLISYVVVNWRDAGATTACVASIRAQEGLDAPAEVVVVDNASTPASRDALAALGVRLVPSRSNTGFAGGANLGIAAARGGLVAVVNNDAVLDRGWTAAGLAVMEAEPDVAIVGGADLAWPDGGPLMGPPRIDPDGGFAEASARERPRGDVLALHGSNLLARADVLRRLRGFDPSFFAYYEDTDLCARVWALGLRVVYEPAMWVRHRRNLTSDRIPFRKHYLADRNHLRLVAKHFPAEDWREAVRRAAVHHLVTGAGGRVSGTDRRVRGTRRRAHLAAGLWGLSGGVRLARARARTIQRGEHYAGFVDHARRDALASGTVPA